MPHSDAVTYHSRRALAELDCAAAAACPEAARAHHALAALHLERLNALAGPAAEPVAATPLFHARPAA